jgi:hypothetical protein
VVSIPNTEVARLVFQSHICRCRLVGAFICQLPKMMFMFDAGAFYVKPKEQQHLYEEKA